MSKKLNIFFLLAPLALFSQVKITGNVKDTTGVVEFANVTLTDQNNTIITGVITDEAGHFELSAKKGMYRLTISFLGYEDWSQNINVTKDTDIGTITLSESKNELGEVVVTTRRPTIKRKVDRLVFNIENSVVASGGDAVDILRRTPGVRVKGEQISLLGKSYMKVMVNNQLLRLSGEDLSNYLRSLNSEDISKIEVITNPPAKYEAEGNSGLINIVLKNVKRDYLGSYIRSTYQQSTYPIGNLSSGITYQKNKLSIFASVSTTQGSIGREETDKVFYTDQLWDTENDKQLYTKLLAGRAGIDYDISDKSSIGIQYLGSINRPDIEESIRTIIFNRASNNIDSLIVTNGNLDAKRYYHSLNGHFKSQLDSLGKKVSVDVDYLKYNNKRSRFNNTQNFLANGAFTGSDNLFKNDSEQDIEAFTSALDFELPLKLANLSFGGKISFSKNTSDIKSFNLENDMFVSDESQSNKFEYKEDTQAAYLSASKSLKKWDFKLGLRLETTQTEGTSITLNQTNTNDYTKLFPTAYITYNPNDKHSYSLNYGRRINRPHYGRLNPFRWFSNPFSFTEGNPFLQPSFTDNIEFAHVYKNNLSTTIYFSKTIDGAEQITLVKEGSNIQRTVWQNFIEGYRIGLIESYTFDHFNWFESYLQANLYYLKVKSTIPNTIDSQDGINFNFSLDNTFYLNKNKTFLNIRNCS